MSTHDRDDAGPASKPRDPALERAWQVASNEQPPDVTDARVLAAARAAVAASAAPPSAATRTRLRPWRGPARWHSLLAAAAVAGLAFILVPRTANVPPRDLGVPPLQQRQEPVTAPAESASAPVVDAASNDTRAGRTTPAAQASGTTRARPPGPARSRDDASLRSGSPVPPPPAATAEEAAGALDATTGADAAYGASGVERSTAAKAAVAGEAPHAAAAPAPQAAAAEPRGEADTRTVDAAAWAARIEALHAAGNLVAAARELQAFRANVPDAESHLPPALREWARTVP